MSVVTMKFCPPVLVFEDDPGGRRVIVVVFPVCLRIECKHDEIEYFSRVQVNE